MRPGHRLRGPLLFVGVNYTAYEYELDEIDQEEKPTMWLVALVFRLCHFIHVPLNLAVRHFVAHDMKECILLNVIWRSSFNSLLSIAVSYERIHLPSCIIFPFEYVLMTNKRDGTVPCVISALLLLFRHFHLGPDPNVSCDKHCLNLLKCLKLFWVSREKVVSCQVLWIASLRSFFWTNFKAVQESNNCKTSAWALTLRSRCESKWSEA